jgi:hypothetical protein
MFATETALQLRKKSKDIIELVTKPFHGAAARSSLSTPRITICNTSSGNGRCSALASSHGARIHTSRSSSVVRITGMALGWIGSTTPLGAVGSQEAVNVVRSRDRL